ncbi:cleavage stimulation factor subunit 2-like [Dorcoceras hygrometricum]|uniref:Cleavage stimulation factor subunit 2-like n=1 Tax=Dorcoceras hygrometricum TaxID=472368 RepID=A0A2Z7BZN6_9LAMI|nr:cleavage stimulation factor subunit 2-like [Dorcoceras hygrometricum]
MKSGKQVSLVGTQSPIERSWSRIISAIHDPQKVVLIATGATSMYSPHVQPEQNSEVKTGRNLLTENVGRRRHGGGRRHHLACGTRPCAAATCAAHGGVPPSIMRKTAAHQACNGRPLSRTFVAQPSEASALAIARDARCCARTCARGSSTCVTLNGSGIQLAVGPQPLRLRNHNFGLAQRIMVKRLATSPHDPLGITDSACKNQLVVVSVQYGPFNSYIPIRSTTIGKSRVSRDPIAMHTSWRSNSDIASVTSIGYPRMKASGESSTTKHRLLHASGPHPIPPPNDPNTTKTSDLSTRQMVTTWKVRTRVVR